MAKFTINVRNKGIVDDIEDAIEQGIRRGGEEIGDSSVNIAKQKIREEGAIWTGELLESFDIDYQTTGDTLRVIITNDADHAAPLEYGAEYTDRGPPVVALIPWVITHMSGIELSDDSGALANRDPVEGEMVSDEEEYVDALDLADQETVNKAFWLQQHIKETGISAVEYMERARTWARDAGNRTVSEYIHKEMQKV